MNNKEKIKSLKNYKLAFRPNRQKHSSGFNCFDLAYYDIENNEYIEITDFCVDHIDLTSFYGSKIDLHLDTKNRWVHLWSNNYLIDWSDPLSSTFISIRQIRE